MLSKIIRIINNSRTSEIDMLIKKKPKTDYTKNMKMKAWAVARLYGELRLIPGAGVCKTDRLWAQWRWAANWPSSVVCVCVFVCVAVLVKTNELSLQSLRCLDSSHRIAALEFSLGHSQAIYQRESIDLPLRALFQYSGWMVKCICFVKRLSACFLPWYDIYLNILRCKIGSIEVPRPFYPLTWRSEYTSGSIRTSNSVILWFNRGLYLNTALTWKINAILTSYTLWSARVCEARLG